MGQRFGVFISEFGATTWDCAIHAFWSSINSIVSTGADAAGAFFFTAAASPFASSDAAGGPAGAAATSRRGAEGRDHDGTAADGIFFGKGAAALPAAPAPQPPPVEQDHLEPPAPYEERVRRRSRCFCYYAIFKCFFGRNPPILRPDSESSESS